MMLVTLQQAKDHLRVDYDDEDAEITLLSQAAGAAIIDYLKSGATFLDSSGDVPVDSSGDPDGVPYQVQAASLILIAELYKNREAEQDGEVNSQFGYGYMPRSVVALLYPLRDPAIA